MDERVNDAARVRLERQFQLTEGVNTEGTTWEYQLQNPSTANVRTIVQHAQVDDTSHLNRIRYRPEFAQDRGRRILVYPSRVGQSGRSSPSSWRQGRYGTYRSCLIRGV